VGYRGPARLAAGSRASCLESRWALLASALLVVSQVSGCLPSPGGTLPTAQTSATISLAVFAASSLTEPFDKIGEAFMAGHPGVEVTFNYGASSALAVQLSEGAPADVFASANEKQMSVAQASGRVEGDATIFAKNHLVVITPLDNPAKVMTLRDLSRPGVIVLLAAPGAPARDYAEMVFDQASEESGYGPDFKQRVLANLVSEEQNVRQVTAKIALGEADAGVVYASDAAGSVAGLVSRVEIPPRLNVTARYPIAVLHDAQQLALAREFINFVLAPEGQRILANWGFLPPAGG
jgi:molybdate transport system substrate-binding protein